MALRQPGTLQEGGPRRKGAVPKTKINRYGYLKHDQLEHRLSLSDRWGRTQRSASKEK
jgi:hypothetical protein